MRTITVYMYNHESGGIPDISITAKRDEALGWIRKDLEQWVRDDIESLGYDIIFKRKIDGAHVKDLRRLNDLLCSRVETDMWLVFSEFNANEAGEEYLRFDNHSIEVPDELVMSLDQVPFTGGVS